MNALATQFDAIIRLWLSPSEYAALCADTDTESDVCLSHDYCDANQAMIDAFEIIHGRDPFAMEGGPTDAEMNAVVDAWEMAKRHWVS